MADPRCDVLMARLLTHAEKDRAVQAGETQSSPAAPETATLVLGLGNPLLGDDGAGWKIVSLLQSQLHLPEVEFDCLDCSGLALMERLVGYRRAILVDALTTPGGHKGDVRCLSIDELDDPTLGHLTSAHDTSLPGALELGRQLGLPLPSAIHLLGIEIEPCNDCSMGLSDPVQEAIPEAMEKIRALLSDLPEMAGASPRSRGTG